MSITRKTDGNFRNVSAGVSFPKSRINGSGGDPDQRNDHLKVSARIKKGEMSKFSISRRSDKAF